MNKLIPTLQTIFVSLAHVLALEIVIYVEFMGYMNFAKLTQPQVSFFQTLFVGLAPLLAVKIGEAVVNYKTGGQ